MRGFIVFSSGLLVCLLAGCAVEVERGHSGEHRRDGDNKHKGDRGRHGHSDSGGSGEGDVSITVAGTEASVGLTLMVKGSALMGEGLEMMAKCIGPTENGDLTRGLANAKSAHSDLDKETKQAAPSTEVMQSNLLLISGGMNEMKTGMPTKNQDMYAAMLKMDNAMLELDKAMQQLRHEGK